MITCILFGLLNYVYSGFKVAIFKRDAHIEIYIVQKPRLETKAGQP